MGTSVHKAESLVRGMDCAEELAVYTPVVLGCASPWTAIATDMGISLLAVLNALRLLKPGHSSR